MQVLLRLMPTVKQNSHEEALVLCSKQAHGHSGATLGGKLTIHFLLLM